MIRVERGAVPSGTFAVVLAAMPHVLSGECFSSSMRTAEEGKSQRVWPRCTRPPQEGFQALLPEYGRPLIPGRFLRALQLGTQRAIVAGQPPIQRAIAHACARMPQPRGDHRTGP